VQNADWIVLFRMVPTEFHANLVVVTKAGVEITTDMIYRTEPTYVALRGRTAGTTDTGRAFFIPYANIDFLRIERTVTEADLQSVYANAPTASAASVPMPVPAPVPAAAAPTPPPTPADPATAKQALLERIRATRSAMMPRPSGTQPPPIS
jgi:hypothetical protein